MRSPIRDSREPDRGDTWVAQAKCGSMDPEAFFVELSAGRPAHNQSNPNSVRARTLCDGCPVIDECLADALADPYRYGIWGGTTPRDRAEMTGRKFHL